MKINVRQICFIMLAYTAVTRLLMYPLILSENCGRDLLIPAVIDFLLEGIIIWAVAFLCSKTDKTFFELLEGTLGNIGARIVFGFFALFFLLSAILPLFEQKMYVHNIFYDTVPSFSAFLPFFVLSTYVASKNFTNIGRCADICLPIFAGTLALIFVMALSEVQWDNLLPMFQTPADKIFKGTAGTLSTFAEPCWLLMFMGHFKYKKGDAAKITISFAAGAAVVILFLAVFYGIYGNIATSRTFAVARVSLFFPAIDMLGRIDLVLLYVLETVMLFALILNIQFAVYTISKCVGYGDFKVISFIVNLAYLLVLFFFNNSYNAISDFYFNWLWIMFAVFTLLLPPLAWLLKRRKNERKN